MFDIGFTEILLILVVAIIVIGPERMPEVARKIGQFIGKTKRFINSVKEDSEISDAMREIQSSINLDEEKKQLESVKDDLHTDLEKMQQEWGIDEEISRPTFGGSEPAEYSGSQFNRAPQQPVLPEKEQEQKIADKEPSKEKTDQTDTASSEKAAVTQQEKA